MKRISRFVQYIKENQQLQESKKQLEDRIRELGNIKPEERASAPLENKANEVKNALKQAISTADALKARATQTISNSEAFQQAAKQAKIAAESLERAAKTIEKTKTYKQVSSTAKAVDNLADVRLYSRPENLRKRQQSEFSTYSASTKPMEPNTEATGVTQHKDFKWYAGWSSFVDSNPYYNKLLNLKLRFDESESLPARMTRAIIDRMAFMMESSKNELAEVLTEINKVDPEFNKVEWLKFCETEIIPNILEAFIQGKLDVLEDWCLERAYNILSRSIAEHQKIGFSTAKSQIIDISKVELVSGKMMEHGPVLVITFQVFMIHVVTNMEGKIVEGKDDSPIRLQHVWVLCRDMDEYNPALAWKLLELHMQASPLSI